MATAILMQKLEFSFVDPEWKMTTKQTAVLKPHNLFMHAKLRGGADVVSLQRDLFHGSGDSSSGASTLYPGEEANGDGALQPMSIFYGSNTGTCESLAERLAVFARQRGFKCTVKALNEAVDRIPIGQPVIFVSSTHYEGQPPGQSYLSIIYSSTNTGLTGVKQTMRPASSSGLMAKRREASTASLMVFSDVAIVSGSDIVAAGKDMRGKLTMICR